MTEPEQHRTAWEAKPGWEVQTPEGDWAKVTRWAASGGPLRVMLFLDNGRLWTLPHADPVMSRYPD